MLKVLLKKQLSEVFRYYFYDAKKNRMRSKRAIAGYFVFFAVIMIGMLGGTFAFLSRTLCFPLTRAGLGWLYFLLMGGIAIAIGAFGSVFNTYSSLYLAKDNDLLLSLPIPAGTIMASRLANVYLLGAIYAATVLIPAMIVYWVVAGVTAARVACGVLLFLIVTVTVLLLSCLLGWVVARLSLRLKNKSFITVLVSLLFVGGYYFCYFKANDLIRDVILHADVYGEKIKGTAYVPYLFGRIGEGDLLAAGGFTVAAAISFRLVWILMRRSFLNIATASGNTGKARYTEKAIKEKSVFAALLSKEFGRFTSSANYMLNCGLGILLLPVGGIFLLIKGREFCEAINGAISGRPDSAAIILCAVLCLISSMNDMAAPAVSLEGKSLWIPQSLPIPAKLTLHAKAAMQLFLSGIPMVFGAFCAATILEATNAVKVLLCLMPLLFTVYSALFNTVLGIRMPLLNWTNETAPIKQGGAVTLALFGGWGISVLFGGLYFLIGYRIGAAYYLLGWSVLYAAAALTLLKWLDTKGTAAFAAL